MNTNLPFQIGITIVEVDGLNGQSPTSENYTFKNLQLSNFLAYILFPKLDYTKHINIRMESIYGDDILDLINKNIIAIPVILDDKNVGLSYHINYNMIDFDIVIGSTFRVKRDSLVVHGKLKPPLTDTDE